MKDDLGSRTEPAIGDRSLIAVQALEIGRLSGHVVPLVPGSFVPVSGEGDQSDSNGSGKTTFLAIVSLLLGDPQWRLGNSQGDDLINLLFDPELAGAAGRGIATATHGYIVGIFEQDRDDLRAVWLRINRERRQKLGPLQVRVYDGFHIARGGTDTERLAAADARWQAEPNLMELGLRDYAPALYGARPRVSAYVRSRGGRGSGPSLLAAEVDQFDPATIGAELLRLCGQEELLQHDSQQRRERATNRKDRDEATRADDVARMREASELRILDSLDAAREALTLADEHWVDHFAQQLVDAETALALDQEQITAKQEELTAASLAVEQLNTAVDEMLDPAALRKEVDSLTQEQALADKAVTKSEGTATRRAVDVERLRTELRDTRAAADGWAGEAASAVEERLTFVKTEHAALDRALKRAEEDVVHASNRLERVRREGRTETAEALAALRSANVTSGCGLLDTLVIGDALRDTLEPALVPWRDAIVVTANDRTAALAALSELPGTLLISGEDSSSLAPSVRAPRGSGRFIQRLLEHARSHPEGSVSAVWDEVTVVAPLARRTTGPDAATSEAQAQLETARQSETEARHTLSPAAEAAKVAQADLVRATAAERVTELKKQSARAEEDHAAAERDAELERRAREAIRSALAPALERLASYDARRKSADMALADAVTTRTEHETTLDELKRASSERTRAVGANPFAERREEARARAARVRLDESTLRKHAQDDLGVALQHLGIDPRTGAGAEQHHPEIAQVATRRRELHNEGRESRMSFSELAGPLMRYLDGRQERDVQQRERILRVQRERAARIEAYNTTLAHLDDELQSLSESIESSVRARLREVSRRFDELDRENSGYGAQLVVDVIPAGDTTDWVVRVEPQWARGPGEPPVGYLRPGNTAMKKQRTINLVLAALLDEHRAHRGSVLILDELGDSLGQQHRLSVLGAIAEAAASAGITVLATCQDSMLDAAGQFADLVVYFRYLGGTEVVNRAPALYGYDNDLSRVRVSAEAVMDGRPLA